MSDHDSDEREEEVINNVDHEQEDEEDTVDIVTALVDSEGDRDVGDEDKDRDGNREERKKSRSRSGSASPEKRHRSSKHHSPGSAEKKKQKRSKSRSRSRSRKRSRSRSVSSGRSASPYDEDYDREVRGYRIYIGDLGIDCSKSEIERKFGAFGSLREVWVARNPPCFAFVVYKHRKDADEAIKAMNGRTICNSRVRIDFARPRQRRRQRGYDPNLRCYQCGERGHFARNCYPRITRAVRSNRSRSRSSSRSRSRSPSRRKSGERSRSNSNSNKRR